MANNYSDVIKQITVDKPYWLQACGLLDSNGGNHTYEDIMGAIAKGLEIKIETTLPTIENTKAFWDTWSGKLVLISKSEGGAGSYVEYVLINSSATAGTYDLSWEKIGTTDVDLTDYAKKSIAGKAGTYTTSSQSATTTSEASAYAAEVTISGIKYDKLTSLSSEAAHTHDVTASASYTPAGTISTGTGTANYTPAGTVSQPTFSSGSAAEAGAHTHTISATTTIPGGKTANYTPAGSVSVTVGTTSGTTGESTSLAHTHSVTAAGTIATTAPATGVTPTYTPAGTISAVSVPNHSHTYNTHDHNSSVSAVTDYPNFSGGEASGTFLTGIKAAGSASLSGTTSFNTNAIKDATLDVATTTTSGDGRQPVVTAVSGSFNTDAIKDITLAASTTITAGPKYVEAVTHNAATLTGTTTFKTDAIKSISGDRNYGFTSSTSNVMYEPNVTDGILSWSVKSAATQDAHTGDIATDGTVGISGGSIDVTTKYMSHTTTAAATGSVSVTTKYFKVATTAAATGTVTLNHSDPTFNTGSVSWTAASLGTASKAKVAGMATPVVGPVTDEAGAFTVTPTFTGTGRMFTFTGSAVNTDSKLGTHTHSYTAPNGGSGSFTGTPAYFSNASDGAHTHTVTGTVSQPTFTGTGAQLVFSGTAATISSSGTAESAGAHTHNLTHTSTSVTGSATAAIAKHTHTYSHTHQTTISNCES